MINTEIINSLLNFRSLRDWEKFHTSKNLACSISIESNELLELFQWSDECKDIYKLKQEIADIAIYLIYLCHDTDIDIQEAITEKIALNEKKYPVHTVKGSSKKYDEL
jgi:NTP pyrophosphatase (non-canonical NTP hydrolase)